MFETFADVAALVVRKCKRHENIQKIRKIFESHNVTRLSNVKFVDVQMVAAKIYALDDEAAPLDGHGLVD